LASQSPGCTTYLLLQYVLAEALLVKAKDANSNTTIRDSWIASLVIILYPPF
jgi:hypothetical protein